MTNFTIHLHFLEPYRLVEFKDKKDRKELRGLSFARWQEKVKDGGWRSIITGSLLRSATLKAAEEILSITSGKVKLNNKDEGKECCNGHFKTDGKDQRLLRKRPALKWSNKDKCGTCPYCILLRSFKNPGNDIKDKNNYYIHFSNLELSIGETFDKNFLKEIASERILNRIDSKTGKAFDYFKVWEVEDERFWKYKGKIEINDEWFSGKDDRFKNASIKLLTDSLQFIDRLCGALCVIEVSSSHQPSPTEGEGGVNLPPKGEGVSPDLSRSFKSIAEMTAFNLFTIFEKTNSIEKLRTFADTVRAMRLKGPEIVKELPKGKDEKGHYIWDLEYNGRKVRQILEEAITNEEVKTNWREFCESVGKCLYGYYKDKTGGIVIRERILGDTEYYSKQAEAGDIIRIDGGRDVKEWIFVGRLKAETPFFFGTEAKGGDQTSIAILLDKKSGRYRIPRSVLRGTLRNDLRFASGTGCNVELGLQRPCECPVCMIMRQITIMNSKSDYCEPPEVRQRIRRNPYTGTVDEGALFDIEVGPEGITFPFVMRYRAEGDKLPPELTHVIYLWKEGQAFLGGSGSTGKGRFKLELEHLYEWDINKDSIQTYIDNHGLRENEFNISSKIGSITDLKENIPFPEKGRDYKEKWQKIEYKIKIKSPLLSADPIEALFDSRNTDSVVYKKRVVQGGSICGPIPAYKGESIRGLVRTAFGRDLRHKEDSQCSLLEIEHEDCTCELCKVFGNEHEASKVRFEDLSIEYENEKKLDHVAIDRFTGGAAEQKKFDDCSLAGSPDETLKLIGRFWIKTEVLKEEKEKQKLITALCDIRDGLYPLGGKGGIGYGWVTDFQVSELPEFDFKLPSKTDPIPYDGTVASFDLPSMPLLPWEEETKHEDSSPTLKKGDEGGFSDKIYNPHYFLKPSDKVDRKQKVIGHEKFHDGKLTGKITCTLKTLTPLIIPDTENNNAFGLQAAYPKHQNFKFFRINGKEMISGSEIRGPISSVYEALTNSCFRVFEEERYLSRRLKPRSGFIPGIVKKEDGFIFIVETKTVRLPLYDDKITTNKIIFDIFESKCENDDHKEKTKKAIAKNNDIAKWAETNRKYILAKANKEDILSGKEKIKFNYKNRENDADKMALLDDNGRDGEGHIKLTGLNMVNTGKTNREDEGYVASWDVRFLNILLNTWIDPPQLKNQKEYFFRMFLRNAPQGPKDNPKKPYKYPRPFLMFIKDMKQYNIYKRCERVFLKAVENAPCFSVPPKVADQYRDLIKDYKNNYGRIDKKFLTVFQHNELEDGDLVYFRHDGNGKVTAVIPVPISRTPDPKPLGKRFFDDEDLSCNLRPCEREILEDIDTKILAEFTEKMLFRRHPLGLCPACRLFGTTGYKSRVRFGFAEHTGELKWLKDKDNKDNKDIKELTLPLLEKPRPTWSMPDESTPVPGRKFYVHHNGCKRVIENSPNESKTENNRTVEALAEGNEFKFEVFFENLEEWELGLLIYSLELEKENEDKKLAHKIGMGKALGFGSVEIKVDEICIRESVNNWKPTTYKNAYIVDSLRYLEDCFSKDNKGNDTPQALEDWHRLFDQLRCLLKFQQREDIVVRYPKLRENDDPKNKPGYVELGDEKKFPFRNALEDDKNKTLKQLILQWRLDYLTNPWSEWYTKQ